MNITKECITNNRRDGTVNIISKITFVMSESCERLNEVNRRIAEKTAAFCDGLDKTADGMNGSVVALLTPTVTYIRDDIISIKYDFTISSNGAIVHHRRFCVNMHTGLGIFVLPRFLSCAKKPRECMRFYLLPAVGDEDGVILVPVKRNLEHGIRIGRRSDIDAYCDGDGIKVKIRIPSCMSDKKLLQRKAKNKKERAKARSAG